MMLEVTSPFGIFLLTYLSYTCIYSTRKPFSVVKSVVQSEFGFNTSVLGLLDGSFLASYALGQIILPSRLKLFGGDKTCLVISFCGSGLVSIILAYGYSQSIFVTLFILNGVLHSIVYPTMIKFLIPHFGKTNRGETLGLWCTSQQIGSLTATALATGIMQYYGWRATFRVSGVLVLCCGLSILVFLPKRCQDTLNKEFHPAIELPVVGKRKKSSDTRAVSVSEATIRKDMHLTNLLKKSLDKKDSTLTFLRVAKTPGVLDAAAAFFCVKIVRYSMLFWIPYYLSSVLHNDPAFAGYTSMMFDLGGIIGSIGAGVASDRWFGGRRFLVAFFMSFLMAMALSIFFFMSQSDSRIGCSMALFILGVCVAGPDIILGAVGALDICERFNLGVEGLEIAAGIINGTGSVGAVVQGISTAYITERFGWKALFHVLSVLSVIAGFCLIGLVIDEKKRTTSKITYTKLHSTKPPIASSKDAHGLIVEQILKLRKFVVNRLSGATPGNRDQITGNSYLANRFPHYVEVISSQKSLAKGATIQSNSITGKKKGDYVETDLHV